MASVLFNGETRCPEPGRIENHFGYQFEVQEDGSLVAEIDDKMVGNEVAAGRVTLRKVTGVKKRGKAGAEKRENGPKQGGK